MFVYLWEWKHAYFLMGMEICFTYCTIWEYTLQAIRIVFSAADLYMLYLRFYMGMEICFTCCTIWEYTLQATGLRSLSIVRTFYGNGWPAEHAESWESVKAYLTFFLMFGGSWPPALATRPQAAGTAAAPVISFLPVTSRAC